MLIRTRLMRPILPIVLALALIWMGTSSCASRDRYAFTLYPYHSAPTSAQREIDELLAFFQQWYRGEIPNNQATFDRLEGVLHENFTIVTPDGETLERYSITSDIRRMHGVDPEARVWATDIHEIYKYQHASVYSYEEHQFVAGNADVRVSTAVFVRDDDAPNGLVWLRVHETLQ
jgi:hypothetical protein